MNRNDDPTFDASVYAAGALDADESAAFEALLESSPAARDELESFERVSAALGLAVQPETPPMDLKASLMARIATTPQLPVESRSRHAAESDADADDTHERSDAPAAPAPEESPVAPVTDIASATAGASAQRRAQPTPGQIRKAQERANRRWYSKPLSYAVAAAAVGVVIVGSSLFAGVVENGNQLPQAVALAEVNAASDVQRTTVDLDEEGGTATLVWSEDLGKSVLVVNGLPQLPDDKTYELWYIGEGGPVSAGVFDTGADGNGWGVLAGALSGDDVVAVTIEKSGGSDGTPTTDPVLVVEPA
ncbi:anti-sigma factor [Labedella endophytica]|jgi:anti-sigma-K factor RskA|uniref:Regulator of SigK n=1 Tax=Labedella endophytica TaxID=1523160 RepID=A0A433JPX2_9MICO|nr:anti-sigma factor [Labedella endophytica]RUQ98999.1 anti-sigma factor [Labedella endophytica]